MSCGSNQHLMYYAWLDSEPFHESLQAAKQTLRECGATEAELNAAVVRWVPDWEKGGHISISGPIERPLTKKTFFSSPALQERAEAEIEASSPGWTLMTGLRRAPACEAP